MTNWAILSGIEGNLAAYEAVLVDIKRQPQVEELFILGDLIGVTSENEKLVQRVLNPKQGELTPQICQGWWEEQCLILHGLGRTGEPTSLIQQYGMDRVKQLWEAVPRSLVEWMRSLDFGFFELDCLLIHGSTVSVEEALTPETTALEMVDRLNRMEANYLFCGRSGMAFQYEIQGGCLTDSVNTLEGENSVQMVTVTQRFVVGVGNVGRIPNQAVYTLFNPYNNHLQFKTVRYGSGKGFKS